MVIAFYFSMKNQIKSTCNEGVTLSESEKINEAKAVLYELLSRVNPDDRSVVDTNLLLALDEDPYIQERFGG